MLARQEITKSCKYVFDVNQNAIVFSFTFEKKLKQRNNRAFLDMRPPTCLQDSIDLH